MANSIDSGVLGALNSSGQSAAASASGGSGLSAGQSGALRENFMTLLVTQLQNQDPLNPMDNQQTTSQLAQINTVSGIEKLNQSLSQINGQIDAGQSLQASGLIGKGVLVPGDRVLLSKGDEGKLNTTPFGVELEKPADNATVTISNGDGQVINRYDLGSVKSGVNSFSWNGKTSNGEAAVDGAYNVSVEASYEGESVPVKTLNYAQVNSVIPADNSGDIQLDLGAVYGRVGLTDIKQIL